MILPTSPDFDGSESMSLARMKELGVNIGTARHERYIGKTRGFVNQHRTSTVSHLTLMHMLEGGSEHLWTCPECNEDTLTDN